MSHLSWTIKVAIQLGCLVCLLLHVPHICKRNSIKCLLKILQYLSVALRISSGFLFYEALCDLALSYSLCHFGLCPHPHPQPCHLALLKLASSISSLSLWTSYIFCPEESFLYYCQSEHSLNGNVHGEPFSSHSIVCISETEICFPN